MNRTALGVALLSSVFLSRAASATVIDMTSFTESTFLNSVPGGGLTGMAWAPDGSNRLFISTKGGAIRIVENGVLLPAPFATISPIYTNSECGVIGLAFDPNFAGNGYVYFFVTVESDEQQIIRYTANGNVGTAKTTIVANLPTAGQNHDGGAVGFGPDGKLYWAIGDNGNGTGVDANLTSLAAKVGRANPDGTIPNDNPFYDDGLGPNADAIWARGFRNPFTFTFQPSTGLLWVNSVGTNYEQVFITRRGDHAGYNDYENNQPASGFISPVISYRTNGADARTIGGSGASRSNNVATFTTTGNHGFRLGGKIAITGVGDASFNVSGYVTAIPSTTQFSIAQIGPNASSGGGTATMLNIGGAISGGAFLESTAVPAAYRGNFFFGDYNSGRVERVTLDGSNVVTSVDHFANNLGNPIDVEVGPDGDLYYGNYSGVVRRARYNATAQGLIVSRRFVRTNEGGSTAFHVRLAVAPAASVDVSVSRTSGDTDVSVSQGAALSFNTTNWSTPQAVRVAAAADADTSEDVATVSAASAGLNTEDVIVRVTDGVVGGGTGGTGGTSGTGGTAGTGGAAGTAGTSGAAGTAGSSGSGGTAGTNAQGGTNGGGTGGLGGTAGLDAGSDASAGSAGTAGTGNADASAGAGGSAGTTSGAGGRGGSSTSGTGGIPTGSGGGPGGSGRGGASGAGATGGRATSAPGPALEDEGCSCRAAGSRSSAGLAWLGLLVLAARRRKRR